MQGLILWMVKTMLSSKDEEILDIARSLGLYLNLHDHNIEKGRGNTEFQARIDSCIDFLEDQLKKLMYDEAIPKPRT